MGARPPRARWLAPSPATLQACIPVHRLVTRHASVPTGEGAGRQRPGRARSPFSTAWIRLGRRRIVRRESRLARFRCPFRHEGGWRNDFCWALITVVAVPRWGVDTVGDIRLSLLTALGLPEI